MNCCRPKRSKSPPPAEIISPSETITQQIPENNNVKYEALLTIPGCKVYLMEEGEALEIGNGDFVAMRLSEDDVPVATVIKVGDELQWPLTKDEPVVKLDAVQYLFSFPMKDGNAPLSYGITFSGQNETNLALLDSFLGENSLFTCSESSSKKIEIIWQEFAPSVQDYNNFLAKAIAGGTGQIVKGMFKLSNKYANQVHMEGEAILIKEAAKNGVSGKAISKKNKKNATKKKTSNKGLKRVRKLTKMTEKMSKALLNGAGMVTGSVMTPIVTSKAGKSFLAMVPGEVLLASLDAVNRILDAAEVAEKQAFKATSGAVKHMVSKRYGDDAGEATEHVLASTGHVAGTAWNILKIRKVFNPASSVSTTSALKNVAKQARKNRPKQAAKV